MLKHHATAATLETAIIQADFDGTAQQAVDARALHAFLEVKNRFNDWIADRIEQYGLTEGFDFVRSFTENSVKPSGGRRAIEYALTVDAAKELAMVERNAKGKEARQYFIAMEKKARSQESPSLPKTYKEAIRDLLGQLERSEALERENQAKAEVIKELAPKADFYDTVASAINAMTVDACAKLLGTGEKRLFELLRQKGYLRDNNHPYQRYLDNGYFRMKESKYKDRNGETQVYTQTLVTQRGLQYLQRKYFGKPVSEESAIQVSARP